MTKMIGFDAKVKVTGNNTGIEVPTEVIERLGASKRLVVLPNVNGYEYRNTVGVMGAIHMRSISAADRKETGLKGGDASHVILALADQPREVKMPADFVESLSAEPGLARFSFELPNSLQRYHVSNINAAKGADTRQRRRDNAVALFREGRQR